MTRGEGASARTGSTHPAESTAPYGIIVPARFGSVRLPGKPLRLLGGRPVLAHVCDNARKTGARFVIVATDDERIAAVARDCGVDVQLTSSEHCCGTDRLAEVVRAREIDPKTIVVNLQGDEPFLEPDLLDRLAETLAAQPDSALATLATNLHDLQDFHNPNVVKVVVRRDDTALYFSRAPIPWPRDATTPTARQDWLTRGPNVLRHVGVYAYRVSALLTLAVTPRCPLEECESLEQLRALWLDMKIRVLRVEHPPPPGIDTEEDLQRAQAHWDSRGTRS